ncbi:hypothetical protein [Edaphobacter aggregans]|uniref:hypothetical protein n=1 Tax=Edaphobacter aggregans TaxID=570835 RepID=UPI0012F76B34|nr:hypothetical protein [Edaphobacter aggregans]
MTTVVEADVPSPPSLSAYGQARSTIQGSPLTSEELRKTDAYWRPGDYRMEVATPVRLAGLSVGRPGVSAAS